MRPYIVSYSFGQWLKETFYPLKICEYRSHFLLHGYCFFFPLGRDIKLEIRSIPLWKDISSAAIIFHILMSESLPQIVPRVSWFGMLSLNPLSQRLAFFFFFFLKIKFSFWGRTVLLIKCFREYSFIMEMKPEKDYRDQRGLWTYPKCQQSFKSLSNWLTRHGC